MFKIIDNKKVEMTLDEVQMYDSLLKSHEPYGKELFKNLFEVNEEGIIVYLYPPQKKFSLEVIIFLQNLMLHQHLRIIYKEHDEAIKEMKSEMELLKKELKASSKPS
jgi:hypothetical protein